MVKARKRVERGGQSQPSPSSLAVAMSTCTKSSSKCIAWCVPLCYHLHVAKSHLSIRIDPEEKKALEQLALAQDMSVGQLARKALKKVVADGGVSSAPQLKVSRIEDDATLERRLELSWLQAHAAELTGLAGDYLVIEGEELVAHGRDPLEVLRQARDRGIQIPFIFRAPERIEGFSAGL